MRALLILIAINVCHDPCRDQGFTDGIRLEGKCRCYTDFDDEDLLTPLKLKTNINQGQKRSSGED